MILGPHTGYRAFCNPLCILEKSGKKVYHTYNRTKLPTETEVREKIGRRTTNTYKTLRNATIAAKTQGHRNVGDYLQLILVFLLCIKFQLALTANATSK